VRDRGSKGLDRCPLTAMYNDDAGPEIGDPCGSPFRTGLMLVQCPSRHMTVWHLDRKDFIHLIIGSGRCACLISVSSVLWLMKLKYPFMSIVSADVTNPLLQAV
jgi:hypothetical protein